MRAIRLFPFLLMLVMGGCSRHETARIAPLTNAFTPATNPLLTLTNSKLAFTNVVNPASPAAPSASRSIGKDIALGKLGALHLDVPIGWQDRLTNIPEADKLFDAVVFKPASGGNFEASVEVIFVGASNMTKLDLHAILQAAGRLELTNSVETNIEVRDFQGAECSGSYFVVTDATFSALEPAIPGNYRFKLQGYAKLNGVVLTIKLVSNHIAVEQPVFLEMIKAARFTKNAPAPKPPS